LKPHSTTRRARIANKPRSGPFPTGWLRPVLLAGLVSLYVARPLLPSEAPTTLAGDGLPFVMLSLMLAVVWLAARANAVAADIRVGPVEFAWCALVACQAVSTGLAMRDGFARAAVNAFWESVGLGAGFLLLRQLLRSGGEKRAILIVMIGLATLLSLDGISQYFIELPALRETYRLHPDDALRELGIDAPPGSAARMLFEQRLNSTEPVATFALANSLAGFLTPWLLITLALGYAYREDGLPTPSGDRRDGLGRPSSVWRRRLGAAACALPMAICLVLTKSRAGYLAVSAGFVALLCLSRSRWRNALALAGAFAAAIVVLAVAGYESGALDREVLTQAAQSLSYRWHYWQGALGMIREAPWFGCGPGNFQDEYTRYKLPQASEVVADPHNFVFEIWATWGTPALVAFAAILAAAAYEWRRAATRRSNVEPTNQACYAVLFGAIGGLVLAFILGPLSTVSLQWPLLLAGFVVLPLVWAVFSGWIESGELPGFVPFVGAVALLTNLLVAGGIGFVGVAGSFWLLLAVAAPHSDGVGLRLPRWAGLALFATAAGLFAACYFTAYRPVLACRALLAQAERSDAAARQRQFEAAEADPLADEPWRRLAAGDFAVWQNDPAPERAARWQQDQDKLLRRRPHSSAAWLEAGERYLAAARESHGQSQRQEYAAAAVEHLRRAAELYPNFAMAHADLALALAAAGQAGAGDEAALALKLHEQTPHADQKLPPELADAVKKLARTAP